MPNGQNRYADKARQRSPRSGRTIRIGKTLGAAPIDGRYTDVVRELSGVLPLLTCDWKRLGKWVIALAEEQDNPATMTTGDTERTTRPPLGVVRRTRTPPRRKKAGNQRGQRKQLSQEERERKASPTDDAKAHRLLRKLSGNQNQQGRGTSSGSRNRRMGQPENFEYWESSGTYATANSPNTARSRNMSPAERSEYFRKLYEADLQAGTWLPLDLLLLRLVAHLSI